MLDIAQQAVDAVFALWGRPASYTPPAGGAAVLCLVYRNAADRTVEVGQGAPMLRGDEIEIRKSEVATPQRGGIIVIYPTLAAHAAQLDGETRRVLEDPQSRDPDRLVWTMKVR